MKHWLKIRHEMYLEIRRRVEGFLGKSSIAFQRYEKRYEQFFLRPWKTSSKEELLLCINNSRLVFLADFHALLQSQKAQLRILKALPRKSRGVLAVEFFSSEHQKIVDDYMEGKISERQLLQGVEWDRRWGFPWEHYKQLLKWAQRHHWRVLALNAWTQERSARSLERRDAMAAQLLAEQLAREPNIKVFVIYGDLHLAPEHLPSRLEKKSGIPSREMCLIFQNSEHVYFQLLKRNLELQVDVIRWAKNEFCLMSIPPWVKWQNYLLFLEQKFDSELPDGGEGLDLTDEVARYVRFLMQELGISVAVDHFSVYTAQSESFWPKMQELCSLDELRYFEHLVEENVSFYLPQGKMAYLAQASVNHAAVIAAAVIQAEFSGTSKYPAHLPNDFLSLIWLEAVLYFGSKIVNPKRKTDTLLDLKMSLGDRMKGEREKEILKLALQQKMNEILYMNQRKRAKIHYRVRRKSSYREAARLLGGMLGEKLSYGFRSKMLSQNTVQGLLRKNLDQENFKNVYFEILEMVESIPEPFQSKQEKL